MSTPNTLPNLATLEKYFIYNSFSGVLVNKIKRNNKTEIGERSGCLKRGYIRVVIDNISFPVHRIVWAMYYKKPPALYNKLGKRLFIDHIDNNKSNNRISNLRLVTNSINQLNRLVGRKPYQTPNGKWAIQLQINSKDKHLGTFINRNEAILFYEKSKQEYLKLRG